MYRVVLVCVLAFCAGCGSRFGQKAPNQSTAVDERVHFELGQQFYRERQSEAVYQQYDQLLAENPDDVATLNNLAWVLVTTPDLSRRNPKRAVQLAQKAVELSGGRVASTFDTLAHAYFYNGELEKAIETEGRAVQLAPTEGKYQAALRGFRRAKGQAETQKRLRSFTGSPAGIELEQPAPPEAPLSADAQARLAKARELMGSKSWAEARAELELVIDAAPDYAPAYNYLGAVASRTGDIVGAIRFYEQATQKDPAFAAAWNNLAWILATAKDEVFRDPLRAVASALQAVELTRSEDPDFLDTLAEAYFAAGRYQDAVQAEQKALALTGGDEQLRRQLERFLRARDASLQ